MLSYESEPDAIDFLNRVLRDAADQWNPRALGVIGGLRPPDSIFAGRRDLLLADIHTLWAGWFLDSILNTAQHSPHDDIVGYGFIYKRALEYATNILPTAPPETIQAYAKALAELLRLRATQRQPKPRTPTDRNTRLRLLDAVHPDVRCWVCGHRFCEAAVSQFADGAKITLPLPRFVDFFKPAGIVPADLALEVDHVVPLARGGADIGNLAIACGWCNRNKSYFTSLYDQALTPLTFAHPARGQLTTPRPLWVIRLLASKARCEAEGCCSSTTRNSELTVSLVNEHGAATPPNLRVVCERHDTMRHVRLVPRTLFQL